jgi:hypothetical protein
MGARSRGHAAKGNSGVSRGVNHLAWLWHLALAFKDHFGWWQALFATRILDIKPTGIKSFTHICPGRHMWAPCKLRSVGP